MISQTIYFNRFEPIEIEPSMNRLSEFIVRGRNTMNHLPMDSAFIIGISRTSLSIFGFYRHTTLFH